MAVRSFSENVFCGMSNVGKRIALLIAILTLTVLLTLGGGMAMTSTAYGQIYPVDQPAQTETTYNATEDQPAVGVEGEEISDDEVPMSSGLGGSEVIGSAPGGFSAVIIAGIVAVVAFFSVLTLRANRSISEMRNKMR